MVTTFMIEPGYAYNKKSRATPEMLHEIAKAISVEQLRDKCVEYGLSDVQSVDGCTLDEFLENYRKLPTDDLTCKFVKYGVFQTASGGEIDREIKEVIRKAFGILMLNECFKRGLSVSFVIC